MDYSHSQSNSQLEPRTLGEKLLVILLQYINSELPEIPEIAGLNFEWNPKQYSTKEREETLVLSIGNSYRALEILMEHSIYKRSFENKKAKSLFSAIENLKRKDIVKDLVTKKGAGRRSEPRTFLFTLPSRNPQECLRQLQRNDRRSSTTSRSKSDPPPFSTFYVERPNVERRCQELLPQHGSLLRIRAPRGTGKTSLLFKLIEYAKTELGYRAVYLNLKGANKDNLKDFLQGLCEEIAEKLDTETKDGVQKKVAEEWKKTTPGSAIKFRRCFRSIFLKSNLFLAIDDIHHIFSTELEDPLCGYFASWHDEANKGSQSNLRNLHLAVAYSTEKYIAKNIDRSPFNKGKCIDLRDFTKEEAQVLLQNESNSWTANEISEIVRLTGGHPHLIQLAAHHVAEGKGSPENIIASAATTSGIYKDYLVDLFQDLRKSPNIRKAFQEVVASPRGLKLPDEMIRKLDRLGLIVRQDNTVKPRNQLYRSYFQLQFSNEQGDD